MWIWRLNNIANDVDLDLNDSVFIRSVHAAIFKSIFCARDGQIAGTCDPSWKVALREIKITVNQGRNPLDGSIYVVPVKQTVPAFDPTVPTGYFANYSLAQTENTTYVYEDVAWVGNKFVGESERGRFHFQFTGNQLVFSVFGASFVGHGAIVRKIRTMVFEK